MKKSKLLTLGLLAGAGLLLSINQAQAADTWVKNGADWNLSQDGSLAKDKWVQNAGSWYHFDITGKMQTGWLKDGNTWYSLADSGAMRTGWYKEGSTWYSLADSGAMRTGWYKEGSTWYSLADSGAMRTGWYKEGSTWYYLHFSGSMMTGWEFIDGKWSYFEKSGAMVADRAVLASDGESYVIGKDGYLANRKDAGYSIHDIVKLGDGQEYLLNAKGDDVIIEKNAWYIRPEFKKFSNKYGDEVANTTLALVDNKEEGQEIDPKAVLQNFQNLPNRYYFDENGHRVINIPAMTTYSEIKKVGNDVYLENPGARLRLGATHFTINNNKLYYLENEQGKLKTGYFVLIDDGMATTHYHILAYADQSGEILKMKRLPSGVSDYLDKEIDGLYGEKIKIESPHSNEYYKVVVVK
ncbi:MULTISPECIES: N-acetylmuramoyl-L-alanine amidase family protein [Streptococcus]|uniref:N-acetylmuramoyl-L-alanine amidase family protein n=1 Tax=Streptococcus TaxID=1301 RepID=UPI00040EBB28|nr:MULTISPECIES: N-acetylmuramoyl-L-alanine amidase family protein [Streptococcus]KPL43845.1 choline-binding protein C [Streptococcus pseudopneumoniae]MBF9635777.1 N-acetylmuramoyl-L-alanine amidase family protein [Streptococcus pseudopneumoniae]MBF9649083.1 N-acetylmuramoyl-L-alanine amidase family protein [Streptococcus pseudopneumoniae]MBF9665467.1 N-acetylmuramoyl-L-alanine amidase family protein [Streptococcus pseudopneumoniae]MBF9680198.1 N-acetylmuramoyl-L-alanine amidase family protein